MSAEIIQPTSYVEVGVLRARGLLENRQFAQSLAAAEELLRNVPENRDLLYLVAVNQRYLGHIPDAIATLQRFELLHPDYGRLYQERGHSYRTIGNSAAAIDAYRQAVALNPALPASWTALAGLCRAAGLSKEGDNAATVAAHLARMPAAVVTASSLFAEGDTLPAERMIRQFLQKNPDDVEAMRLLARIGIRLKVLDDAEFLLESVLEIAPDYHAARYDYATVLADRHKHAQALQQVRKLLAIEPENTAFRTLEGNALAGIGQHDSALGIFFELRTAMPDNPTLHLAIGHGLKTVGRQQEAIESYRRAATIRPDFGDAFWSLANLKTFRFGDEDITHLRSELSNPRLQADDRVHFCFALGKALEDRSEYAEAFACYSQGNALRRAETQYDPAQIARSLRRQTEVCTREFLAAHQNSGCSRPDPIFIVGLPRAGSTLVEQILASHSQVEGTKELADIARLVQHLNGREPDDSKSRYPLALEKLTADNLREYGENFLKDTQIYRTGRPFFIDKMPNNFRHIGLIHLILPNARIIDARREPMACCFSNFKQLFANGQEYTYSLKDIGCYYRTYVDLMAHWDAVLPGKVLRVQHERLVVDLDASVRRLLDFCGLNFEPACVEFYKTERSIRTASSEQVRQPINRDGMDQWRHFEPWLGPLKAALGDLI